MPEVKTRFAPSPTGYLHIGGLRTALFTYLHAKKNKGKFFLRIEDTDRNRYVESGIDAIKESLLWLGLQWDGDIIQQSDRLDIYKKACGKLLTENKAYYCFCTEERLENIRNARMKSNLPSSYDKKCRNLSSEEIQHNLIKKLPYVIRLKVPENGTTICNDLLRGAISFENSTLEDIIILKSDGFPTYHLAHVVDDHEMDITHITRGEEWISSMPVHHILFDYLNYEKPIFVHLPVVLSTSGKKLSKREGDVSVLDFIQKGYLPEAMLNFLALLGWSYDDQKQLFSKEELVALFDLAKVSKSPAVFSTEKLNWFNGSYIRMLDINKFYNLSITYFQKAGFVSENTTESEKNYILKILPHIQERITILSDIESYCQFFFKTPAQYNIGDFLDKKRDRDANYSILQKVLPILEKSNFTESDLEEVLKQFIETTNLKVRDVFMPIRIAVSGSKFSPGLFETLSVIGKKESLQRITNAIQFLSEI